MRDDEKESNTLNKSHVTVSFPCNMVMRSQEEDDESSPWEKLEAANETMASLADGSLANVKRRR